MQTTYIFFMIFALLVCIFAIVVIIHDMIVEKRIKKQDQQSATIAIDSDKISLGQNSTATFSISLITDEELIINKKENQTPETKENIIFSANTKQTLKEKYEALSSKEKCYYDEIVKRASNANGVRCYKNNTYEEYKIGARRIVRLTIKRDIIHCEFIIPNNVLQDIISENKIRIRQSATVVKVVDEESLNVVLTAIDVATKVIDDEKVYKKQLAKEKRRERRLVLTQTEE